MDVIALSQQCLKQLGPPAMVAVACKPRARPNAPPAQFARIYRAAAQRAGAALRVHPDVLLGQWGLETRWGKSIVPGTNNLGNIKDFSGRGVSAIDNLTGSVDKYRAFSSPDEFADQYASLIQRRYPAALGAGAHAGKFAMALKAGGYAEDANYAAKLQASYRMVAGRPAEPMQQQEQQEHQQQQRAVVRTASDDAWAIFGAKEI